MYRKVATLISAAAVVAVTAPALAGGVDPIRVEARMSAGYDQAQAKARYRDRARRNSLEQRFDVEVEDFDPGTELVVTVNGMTVGTIFVNGLGVGELQLRTAAFIDDPDDGDPIDTDFPRLQAGDTVSARSSTIDPHLRHRAHHIPPRLGQPARAVSRTQLGECT